MIRLLVLTCVLALFACNETTVNLFPTPPDAGNGSDSGAMDAGAEGGSSDASTDAAVDGAIDSGINDAGTDDASVDAGTSCVFPDARPGTLATPSEWSQTNSGALFFGSPGPDARCDPQAFGAEELGGVEIFTVHSESCDFVTVMQPSILPICKGATVQIQFRHSALNAPLDSTANVGVVIGDKLVWQESFTIPQGSSFLTVPWLAPEDFPAGTPILFHVDNHGDNDYSLVGLRVLGAGDRCLFPADIPGINVVLGAPNFDPPVIQAGQPVQSSIAVNAATRIVQVELRDPFSSSNPVDTFETTTDGDEAVPVSFPTDGITGRYYLRITLCGESCSERSVTYEITAPVDVENPTLPDEYNRVTRENGEIVMTEESCVALNTIGING